MMRAGWLTFPRRFFLQQASRRLFVYYSLKQSFGHGLVVLNTWSSRV